MKKRKILCLLGILLTFGLACPAYGQSTDADESEDAAVSDFTIGGGQTAVAGDWFWGLLADPILLSGTTAVAVDASDSAVLYAGGAGFIAVSKDNGANWQESYRFSDVDEDELDADDDEDEGDEDGTGISSNTETKADKIREYLRQELEEQFGTSFTDDLLEDITDDELLQAKDVSDIEALQNYELDMDPDLTKVQLDTEIADGISVSPFDSYIDRFVKYVNSGAERDVAVSVAARSSSVSAFVTTPSETYAVTPDMIYFSVDKGTEWMPFMSAPGGGKVLSMAVSEDSQIVAIGMTGGVLITRNGGEDWAMIDDAISGGAFEIHLRGNNIWVLSTEGIYRSTDRGLTWKSVDGPWSISEYVIDIVPGGDSNLLVLTNQTLYYSADARSFNIVPTDAVSDMTIRQIISNDPSLATFTLRTDSKVYQYGPSGWISQNKSLNATELGPLAELNDGYSHMLMASPTGLWLAQDASVFESSPEYQAMHKQWAKEPSDDMVIQQALDAHFVGEMLDKSWGTRSRLSWLLPKVGAEYYLRQQVQDRHQIVTDMQLAYVTSDKYTFKRETTWYWQIVARWEFGIEKGLRDEMAAANRMASLRKSRFKIVKDVQTALAKRRAYQMTVTLDFPKLPKSRGSQKKIVKTTLGLQEIEAQLHYMTGGYYLNAIHANKQP